MPSRSNANHVKLAVMLLEYIEASDFRNLSGKVFWGTGLNIIYGDNAQGKTNWLEAIYLLATSKSFRTQRLQEAIRFDENLAMLRGSVVHGQEFQRDLQITLQGSNKSLHINGKKESLARYLGQLHAVVFTVEELDVVRGVPESRRRFIDRGAVSIHPTYLTTLADYNRVIKQKNRLLQNASECGMKIEQVRDLIAPWNEQLVQLSSSVHKSRTDYIKRLNDAFERRLFENEDFSIRYVSSLEGKGDMGDYESLIAERLQLRLQAELAAGYSLVGPHRDDLEILFDGRDVRTFGSSGQQRSALITLDLAAISVYYAWHKDYPLFLMDDVDAELDGKRIGYLLEYLEGRSQAFITTSKESLAEQYKARANAYLVKDGFVVNDELNGRLQSATKAMEIAR
jgi:DNA replication and repair protein RecF